MITDGVGSIHPTALVAPSAQLGANVTVGAYAIVEEGVILGADCRVGAHAIVRTGTRAGDRVRIDSQAVIGGPPQDLSFDEATVSGVVIGNDTTIREGVTIHRSTRSGEDTVIGNNVFLMATAHVAHDCRVEDQAILANGVLLAGHVRVGRNAFLGGGAVFHQFVQVGESAMVSGGSRIAYDIPPYTIAAERSQMYGLNLIGLRRRQFAAEVIADIKQCYRFVCSGEQGPRRLAGQAIDQQLATSEEGRAFLQFVAQSKRGIIRPARETS